MDIKLSFGPAPITPHEAADAAMVALSEALSIVTDDEELTARWTRARDGLADLLTVDWVQQ